MTNKQNKIWIKANWPAPNHIKAGTTIRMGGHSNFPYNELNLGLNVGDNIKDVEKNRLKLKTFLNLPNDPIWLDQTHSKKILPVDNAPIDLTADGSYTAQKNKVCVVTTADCVPILFCDTEENKVAAIHAGWKGICNGIIEDAVKIFSPSKSIIVWIGPAISQRYYQVGEEVYCSFLERSISLENAFKKNGKDWYCSLCKIVKIILNDLDITEIYECGLCTYEMNNLFFSYRRDGKTGRTATMIWIE